MSTHPIFTEQEDDEDWTDWYLRQLNTVADNPPVPPEGFYLIPCHATPRHWPLYALDDGEGDSQNSACPDCGYMNLADEHRTCDHDLNHKAWRRSKLISKALGKLYAIGLIKGYGHRYGRGCNGCISGAIMWSFFTGPYILGIKRETWQCWRAGHRRGEEIGMGFCGKCLPQPCCGHTGSGHKDDCDQKDAF